MVVAHGFATNDVAYYSNSREQAMTDWVGKTVKVPETLEQFLTSIYAFVDDSSIKKICEELHEQHVTALLEAFSHTVTSGDRDTQYYYHNVMAAMNPDIISQKYSDSVGVLINKLQLKKFKPLAQWSHDELEQEISNEVGGDFSLVYDLFKKLSKQRDGKGPEISLTTTSLLKGITMYDSGNREISESKNNSYGLNSEDWRDFRQALTQDLNTLPNGELKTLLDTIYAAAERSGLFDTIENVFDEKKRRI